MELCYTFFTRIIAEMTFAPFKKRRKHAAERMTHKAKKARA